MAYTPPAIVSEIIKRWDEAKKHHDLFVRKYERSERAYRGIMDVASDAAKWRHHYAPKYAFNLVETIVSNTIEMGLRMDVRPAPHALVNVQEAVQMAAQAEAVGELLRHEHRVDEMDDKQRPLFLCDALGGRGIGKTYWNYRTGPIQKTQWKLKDVPGPDGQPTGLQVPVAERNQVIDVVRDHSTTEVIDPRDFVVHESAKSLQPWEPGGAQYVFHRCYYSYEQLLAMQRGGFLSNVEVLKANDRGISLTDEYGKREEELWNINRAKDLIEVLEYWKFEDGVVKRALVGNRIVLLRDLEVSPFLHGSYPFFLVSSSPQPFSTHGFSDMELIEELQAMLWEITNQRLDNVELINNWITLIRSDVDDPDAFDFYPGARWPVESPQDVSTLQPPYQLLQGTIPVEMQIRTDLQNVTAAAPFAGGTDLAAAPATGTATGASMVMNAAQQRMLAKKYQAQRGLVREAAMRIKNCQQFISAPRLIHVMGPEGAFVFKQIDPVQMNGDFVAELEPMGESNMRQERRAEAMQWAQTLMGMAPALAVNGLHLDGAELIKWLGRKWGIDDVERFFAQGFGPGQGMLPNIRVDLKGALSPEQEQGYAQMQGFPGQPTTQAGIAGVPQQSTPNLGITSGQAIDASKPSAAGGISGSPVAAIQRALAMRGLGK